MERALAVGFAIATGLALLGAIGLGVSAAVLRYRGRPVPASVVRLAAGLLGLGQGVAFIWFIEEPATLVPLIAFAALPAYWLLRVRNSQAASSARNRAASSIRRSSSWERPSPPSWFWPAF